MYPHLFSEESEKRCFFIRTMRQLNMDKILRPWYRNKQMRFSCATLLLMLSSATAAEPGEMVQRQKPQHWDIERHYIQAKATLEDPNNSHVQSVPMLLENCMRAGHTDAFNLLLNVYEGKFKGLPARPEKAFQTVKAIADAPTPQSDNGRNMQKEACYRLALYLERGLGCKKNAEQAYISMKKAAELGLLKARVEQSRYLMRGFGHKKEERRAWKFLRIVAEQDPKTPNVFYYMGTICYEGLGHRPDMQKARKLYSMGARMGDANCLNNLAAMYERGKGVYRSEELALLLYRKAATMGSKEASANMQRLAFKVGQKPERKFERPAIIRIRNATHRVILSLPFSDHTRSRIRAWMLGKEQAS